MQYWLIFALCAQTWRQTKNSKKVPLFLLLGFLSRLMISLCIQMGQAKPMITHSNSSSCFLPSIQGTERTILIGQVMPFHCITAFFRINTIIKVKSRLIFLYIANTRVLAFLLWAKGKKHTKLEQWHGEWWPINLNQQYTNGREHSIPNYFNFSKKWIKARREVRCNLILI